MKGLSSLHRIGAGKSVLHTRQNPLQKTFKNLSVLPFKNLSFSAENFAPYLDRCTEIDSLKRVHANLLVHNFRSNIFLGSKLIISYARFGLISESRWVLNQINDSLHLWNLVLAGYSRIGFNDEVMRLYSELRQGKIGVDSYTVTLVLKCCVEFDDLGFGRSVHADSFKFGLNAGCFVGSSLIRLYSKCDDIVVAARVFDEITERDVVVYTSLITGYAQFGGERAFEAFRLAQNMQREGLEPNRVTLVSLLQASSCLAALVGKSIHGYAVRRGIGLQDEIFETCLMDMYMRCGLPDKAALTFGKMSIKTVDSWNALIAGHLQSRRPLKSLKLLHQMIQENHAPDPFTLTNGLLSCAYLEDLAGGKCMHAYIFRHGIQLDLVATTALIDIYSRCNQLICAKEIFDQIKTKDVVSFNVMIAGLLENGFACQVTDLVVEMIKIGLTLNVSTILNLLCALSNLKDIRQGKSVHAYVFRHGFGDNTDIANQLVNIYTKCYCLNGARQVFHNMKSRDVLSWTTMITGLVNHGLAEEAVGFFRLMQVESLNPDSVTFTTLLQGFSQLGCLGSAKEVHCRVYRACLDDDESVLNSLLTTYSKCGKLTLARNLFERMDKRNLSIWNSMISAYGMHGDCIQAFKLFELMKEEKVAPDELTFRSLLSACSHSGYVVEGLQIFKSMKEDYDVNPSDEHYGCVVDLLSRAGHLEEAYDLLNSLPSSENCSPLSALLAGCRIHTNKRIGEVIGQRLLDMDTQNSRAYSLVSNLYAENEDWEQAAKLRGTTGQKGLESVAGYSSLVLG